MQVTICMRLHGKDEVSSRAELGNLFSLWQQDRISTKLDGVVPVIMRSLQQVAARFRKQVLK